MQPPVIHLDQIPDGGWQAELPLAGDWLAGVLGDAALESAAGKSTASVRLDRDGNNVYVSGRFSVSAGATCVACLEPVTLVLAGDLKLILEPAATGTKRGRAGHDEVELTRDELDVDTYADEKIDLAPWLREAILLEAPLHPRHDECPVKIEMPAPMRAMGSVDPRLAPLARLLKKE